jgi:hypothetical protein
MDFSSSHFPFKGRVEWLAPEQGGRPSGPPPLTDGYAQVAYVLPHSATTGLASFVLRKFDPNSMTSRAEGRWLFVEAINEQSIEPGSVVVFCEGSRPVAHFRVDAVD